jgi:hypothetical protein
MDLKSPRRLPGHLQADFPERFWLDRGAGSSCVIAAPNRIKAGQNAEGYTPTEVDIHHSEDRSPTGTLFSFARYIILTAETRVNRFLALRAI